MYEVIFKESSNLQQRLSGDTAEDSAVVEAYAPDDSETAATLAAMPTLSDNGGGSFWSRLFEIFLGWLKPDRVPETKVSAPDAGVTEPEPVQEQEMENVPSDSAPTEEATPKDTGSDPAPTPVSNETDPVDNSPTAPTAEESESVSVARQVAPTTLDGSADASVAGGRVTTFALPDAANITGITINTLPAHGNVTVNPDFTLALMLSGSDYEGPLSFDYTVTRSDSTTEAQTATLDVAAPTQAAGWGLGNHYMLETDANDNLVVEHGDNHRKVYVSGSEDALTRADIAAYVQGLEGLEDGEITESMITTQWLRNNPEYGGSEGMALAADVGMELWYDITGRGNGETSHWLMFERGHNYGDVGQLVTRGSLGESELHPIHITSWGEGYRPIIESEVRSWQSTNKNHVISDITMAGGFLSLEVSENFLLDGVKFDGHELNVQGVTALTIRNSEIIDAVQDNPTYVDGLWGAHASRSSGMYAERNDGLLLEGTLVHHNAWEEGYDGTDQAGQPPSMYSHNIYLQHNNADVTLRDNVIAQGASFGAQVRSGGYIEGNLFLDNNVAVNFLGGDYQGAGPVGYYTLFADNIITSAGYKDALTQIGAKDWGVRNEARDSTLLNNILAHLADPNNPDEMVAKPGTGSDPTFNMYDPFFDDTTVFNWNGYDANLDGLDPAALNQITIQNFAMEFLGLDASTAPASEDMGLYYKSGLIYALMDYARENWGDGSLTAQDIIDYFQAGFGFDLGANGATHHRFIPNDLGDGVRWDNRLNWTSDALPIDGDTVDLGGNWVNFSDTVTVASLDLGTGGKLQVGSGKLTVDALETGDNGMIFVERAGQVWTDDYSGDAALSVQVTGGRFANTGDVSGPVIASVQGGQVILAADNAQFLLAENSELRINGTAAKVGFDGATDGVATLIMQDGGQLSFVADATGLARVNEFRSGAWDQQGSAVHSGVALDGTLALDLNDYIGTGSMKLIEVDAISGMFDNVDIHGLGDKRDANLIIDYAADLVTLELSAGTGQGNLSVIGDASDGTDEEAGLWDALTLGLEEDGVLDPQITILDDMIDPLPDMTFI